MLPTSDSLINIHSHFKPRIENEFVIRNAFLKINAAHISKLNYPVSVGLHPWHINEMAIHECEEKLNELASLKNVFAIGEIGIDRSIQTNIKVQLLYFEIQLSVAEKFKKPIIIHSVKSYSDIIPYLKKSPVPFIFHAFSGNEIQAIELLKYNCKLSFGKNLFYFKQNEILKSLPDDSFFLETDSANHINIFDVYNKAAEIRKIKTDVLKAQLFHTFAQTFSN